MPKPESPERRTATEAIMQGAKMEQLDALVKFMLVHKLTLHSLLDRVKNPPERTALRELVEAGQAYLATMFVSGGTIYMENGLAVEVVASPEKVGFQESLARAEAVLNQPEAVRKGEGK